MPVFLDPRDYQIGFLLLFLLLGISTRDWTLHPEVIAVAIATCLLTQVSAVWVQHRWQTRSKEAAATPLNLSLRSALITGLGLSLLLRVDHWTSMAIAAALAILSKFIFRVQGKHFFNPANFGLIAALSLTGDAWVSPGQWGENVWYGLLFCGAGGLVLRRVGRWDTTAAFLGCYILLEAGRNLWLGWTWDVWLHRCMSGSLLLFALFMVTDPRSIPDARFTRLLWAGSIAGLTFMLRNYFLMSTSLFWALFLLAPLTVLLDRWHQAPRFVWRREGAIASTLCLDKTEFRVEEF